MVHVASLVQSLLWAALMAVCVWLFHEPVHGILVALQRGIEGGRDLKLKLGPVELGGLHPSTPEAQRSQAEREGSEAAPIDDPTTASSEKLSASPSRALGQLRAFLCEDLALRTVQSEYGALVQRNVKAQPGSRVFDGFFVNNGRPTVVEVRFIRERASIQRLTGTLDRIAAAIQGSPWPQAQLLLVLVIEDAVEVPEPEALIRKLLGSTGLDVQTRTFSMVELFRRFGLPIEDG